MIPALARVEIRLIITDTVGRTFRRGQAGSAAGWSGIDTIRDFRGDNDLIAHKLKITGEAVVGETAGFAHFIMGESNNEDPAVIFCGCGRWKGHDDLLYREYGDLLRELLKKSLKNGF